MTCKCIFTVSTEEMFHVHGLSAWLKKPWNHEVRLCSHHTWITPSKSWITAELASVTKQTGGLSVILLVDRLNREKEAHMDLSFQKLNLIPQSYTISMTITLVIFVFWCTLQEVVFLLWLFRFLVSLLSHNLISLVCCSTIKHLNTLLQPSELTYNTFLL